MLYNIFSEFLEDVSGDTLPNDMTGYQDTLVWNKLFNFQRDAATGIINKMETFNGCILADSVGLGKTFTALAVIKYYELRNRSVLVLCPKKLSDNWLTFNARSLLGGALLGQKRYEEAEPLLLSGYKGLIESEDTIPPAGKVRVKVALQRLVQLYEAWGKPSKAALWKKELAGLDIAGE